MVETRAEVRIRPLRVRELPAFLRFQAENDYKALPGESDTPSLLYSFLKMLWHGERIATFVAERPGEGMVGYISLVFGKTKKFRGNAYLVSAAVRGALRGQGIGSKLFTHVEDYARRRGARRIEFDVFAKNEGALRLYKRLGYEVEGVKRRAVEHDGEHDDLVFMAKFVDGVAAP